jgi:hypothetical protein
MNLPSTFRLLKHNDSLGLAPVRNIKTPERPDPVAPHCIGTAAAMCVTAEPLCSS